MHALYDEVDCLKDRVVTMVADKLKRQYLNSSSFSILTILEHLLQLYHTKIFGMIEALMVAPTNICG